MELIRTKRATSTAGSTGPAGQPKSKYRKRSVSPAGFIATVAFLWLNSFRIFRSDSGLHPQGSAILVTSERHPNGAVVRTEPGPSAMHVVCVRIYFSSRVIIPATVFSYPRLLDYAKLMRKRDKNNTNGEPPVIDMETLRASARAADIADKSSRSSKQAPKSRQTDPTSPLDSKQAAQHHQSSFQLVTPMVAEPSTSTTATETSRAQAIPSQQHQSMPPPNSLPPPPWATPATTSGRVYATADHLQHQSFMRSSQHTPANHAPSR